MEGIEVFFFCSTFYWERTKVGGGGKEPNQVSKGTHSPQQVQISGREDGELMYIVLSPHDIVFTTDTSYQHCQRLRIFP